MSIEKKDMVAYVQNAMAKKSDYSFLPEKDFEQMVNALVALDIAYMESESVQEEGLYDDEAAYVMFVDAMKKQFPQYQMYLVRLTEDYMDAAEEFLESSDALEWD